MRIATVVCDGDGEWMISGLADLIALKTSGSDYSDFVQDPYPML